MVGFTSPEKGVKSMRKHNLLKSIIYLAIVILLMYFFDIKVN